MQIDFSDIEDAESYVSIPEGIHPCRVAEVREGLTREGHPRWAFRLEVALGPWAGRTAAWDSLVWSPRGLPRVKAVLSRLGFDVSGRLSIESSELVGRRVRAELVREEREDPQSGRRIARLRVPYVGYERDTGAEDGDEAEESPF